MTATPTPVDYADRLAAEAAQQRADIDAAQRAAAEAEQAALEAADAARRAELVANKGQMHTIRDAMSDIGARIDAVDATARKAVIEGKDPAAAWVRRRLALARLAGEWDAIAGEFQNATGRGAPDGPVVRIRDLPGPRGGFSSPNAEGFTDWLEGIVRDAQEVARNEARDEAVQAIRKARGVA